MQAMTWQRYRCESSRAWERPPFLIWSALLSAHASAHPNLSSPLRHFLLVPVDGYTLEREAAGVRPRHWLFSSTWPSCLTLSTSHTLQSDPLFTISERETWRKRHSILVVLQISWNVRAMLWFYTRWRFEPDRKTRVYRSWRGWNRNWNTISETLCRPLVSPVLPNWLALTQECMLSL